MRHAYFLPTLLLPSLALAQSVNLTVNASSSPRTVDERLFGVNAVMWDPQASSSDTVALVRAAGVRIIRVPGGSNSDEYHWTTNKSLANSWTWATGFDGFTRLITGVGTKAFVTTNYGTGTPQEAAAWVAYANANPTAPDVPIGSDGKTDWLTAGHWAGLRASLPLATDDGLNFLRIGSTAPLGIQYWEIGNEVYGSWETDQQAVAHDPYTYAVRAKDYISMMKAVDPTIAVGVVATTGEDGYANNTSHPATNPRTGATHNGWTPVLLTTLKSRGATPDFLIYHRYDQNPGKESDASLLQSSATWPSDAADLRGQLNDYLGTSAAAPVELLVTEHNSVSSNPGKQSTSLVDGLFLADSFGALLNTEFKASTWWALRNGPPSDPSGNLSGNNSAALYGWRNYGDYGWLSTPHTGASTSYYEKYPTYYAMKLVSYFAAGGDTVLSTTSDNTLLAVYAVKRAGNLRLLVVNKDPSSTLNANIALSGFTPPAQANSYTYAIANDNAAKPGATGCADITGASLNVAGATFSASFPPYSMTVLLLGGPAIALSTATPAINAQPAASSLTAGANATFTVAAAGCPAPTYQWQRQAAGSSTWQDLTESSTYSGVQSATLTVSATTVAMSGDQFRAQTSNSAGNTTSNAVALTVTAAATPTPTPSTPSASGGGGGGGGGKLDLWLLLALATLVFRVTGFQQRPKG
jgi:alpha-L-arabinofuranosidase